MKTFKSFPKEDILPQLGEDKPRIPVMEYDGEVVTVKPDSLRLLCLKRSQVCVECGCEGVQFRVEAHESDGKPIMPPHIALYSEGGVLLTKALIDFEGPKHISNVQTMCKICNDKRYTEYQRKRNSSG